MRAYQTVAPSVDEFQRRMRNKAGRKRGRSVTLPQIHALLAEELDPVLIIPDRHLPADDPRRKESEQVAKRRAGLRKVALALQADPLGITTGGYGERPRYGVGEVTAERMAKIQHSGGWVGLEQEKTAKGADTGLQRRRIKSVIEVWFERGAISRAAWLAAQALQRDHDLSISCTSSLIAKYQATVGVAHRELMGQEASVEFMKAKFAALASVDPIDRPIADWIIACSNDDVPADSIARKYHPELSAKEALSRFKALFERCCASLSRHYQHRDQHRWTQMARTVGEIAEMMPA